MIGYVNDVASYIVSHDGTNVLCRRLSGSSIVEKVRLIGEQVKSHTYKVLKTIGEDINPIFYAWVIIEHVAVKVAKLRGILLEGRA